MGTTFPVVVAAFTAAACPLNWHLFLRCVGMTGLDYVSEEIRTG